jgi:hypothetical protein
VATLPPNTTAYDDTTASSGVVYAYSIIAFNYCGDSSASAADAGSLTRGGPSSASDCQATDDRCGLVRVTWRDNSADETGFQVLRDGLSIALTPPGTTLFDDTTGEFMVVYAYTIVAVSECGEAVPSNPDEGHRVASEDPPPPPLQTPPDGARCLESPVTFSWSHTAAAYELQVGRTCGGEIVVDDTVTVAEHTVALPPGVFEWRVRARSACDEWGSWSACRSVGRHMRPPPPEGLDNCILGSELSVHWRPSEGAELYILALADACYGYEGVTLFTVAGTDTTIDLDEHGLDTDFMIWVSGFACGAEGDASECIESEVCGGGGGTPILLEDFRARCSQQAIVLEWAMTSEGGIRGFHLYRRAEEAPVEVRLTTDPIPAGAMAYRYEDRSCPPGGVHVYRLTEAGVDGAERTLGELRATMPPPVTALFVAGPNPARGVVPIELELARAGITRVEILDSAGRLVARLLDRDVPAGRWALAWDGRDASGLTVASGKYFVRLEEGDHEIVRSVILVR